LQVERERGITVKTVTASLQYTSKVTNEDYLLNLVDTPGHVDFANEVSRALAACQSVILLVDANQGVQAQTYANFYLAFANDLLIIPVLNKIDLKNAKPEEVEKQLHKLFDVDKKDVLRVRNHEFRFYIKSFHPKSSAALSMLQQISAKLGTGVEELLEHIIDVAPPPPANREAPFKGLLFDSWYQPYEGVIILIYVKDGAIKAGDVIVSHQTGNSYTVKYVGILRPTEHKTSIL
jgi:small GTP-binding protein